MNIARLYSSAEATDLKLFPIPILKRDFDPVNYRQVDNVEWSEPLDTWVNSRVLLAEKVKVFSIWFEDGSCWDTHVGWRPNFEYDNYVEMVVDRLKTIKNA